MPKRTGWLYDKVISEENCIAATLEMTKGKRKNGKAMRIRERADAYGRSLAADLASGRWQPKPYKEHTVLDGARKKERHIKVPCLRDQAVHHAVMRVTAPFIQRRNYFYNCGSIPGAGQIRATRALKRWMAQKKACKYCEQLDIRKFYESCPHETVMKALKRIFKDRRFLALHSRLLDSMGDGLAIGFYPSQWYANLVLGWADSEIKQRLLRGCHYVRYMDDMCILGDNKRAMRKAREALSMGLALIGLSFKRNYKIFRIGRGAVQFLSYRFFKGYTLLKKQLMFRMSRRFKRLGKAPSLHDRLAAVSYFGILKQCDSGNFMRDRVYPYFNFDKCRRYISNADRARIHAAVAV